MTILVSCLNRAYQPRKRPKLFRYEASWNLSKDCPKIVERFWNQVSGQVVGPSVPLQLKLCQAGLTKWSISRKKNQLAEISGLTKKLKVLQVNKDQTVVWDVKRI